MAERILMNEFKALSKEKWVTIEASIAPSNIDFALTSALARWRERSRMGCCSDGHQSRFPLLFWVLQRPDDFSIKLSVFTTKY